MALKGTVKKQTAFLCQDSAFAVEYAQAWADVNGRPGLALSAIYRRALLLYVAHLDSVQDPAQESRELNAASVNARVFEGRLEGCMDRLAAAMEQEAPLPPFAELKSDPAVRQWAEAVETRVDSLIKDIHRGRLARPTTTQHPTPTT